MKGKIAISTFPGVAGGGVFTSFLTLKENLEPLGWSVTGISIGNKPWDSKYEGAPYNCVRIAGDLDAKAQLKAAAIAFVDWVIENDIDIIVPLNSPVITSAIPFLPAKVKVVMRCNTNTARVYKYISTFPEYVSSWIFVSQGQIDGSASYKIPSERSALIPHGISISKEEDNLDIKGVGRLRLGFLGRLHHGHKGVFLLPEILKELDESSCVYTLEIVGSGEDEVTLRSLLKDKAKAGIVSFKGAVKNEEVKDVVRHWDIFLMPSRIEGFGIVLIETMVMGVVPVASKIPGVTDWIIKDGYSGYLCEMDKVQNFVEAILKLDQNRALLNTMSTNARQEVEARFSLETSISKYDQVFTQVLAEPERKIKPKHWDNWEPYQEYKPFHSYFTNLIPKGFKNYLKRMLN